MRVTVLCNEDAIGEIELDPAKPAQSASLAPLAAFERIRSRLERAADARADWAARFDDAMPESLFASLCEAVAGGNVVIDRLDQDWLKAEYPELASLAREQTARNAASPPSWWRLTLKGEDLDARIGSAAVRLWMPPSGVRRSGVPTQVIVSFDA